MLASTMHFSNNTHRTSTYSSASHHKTHQQSCAMFDIRRKLAFSQNPDSVLGAASQSPGKLTTSARPYEAGTLRGVFDVSPSNTHPPHRHTPAEMGDVVCSLERR